MTKPLPLSDVATAVIEANTDWDEKDIEDVVTALEALDRADYAAVRGSLRSILLRNLTAVTSQTYLVAEKHARAEMEVMAGNSRERAS